MNALVKHYVSNQAAFAAAYGGLSPALVAEVKAELAKLSAQTAVTADIQDSLSALDRYRVDVSNEVDTLKSLLGSPYVPDSVVGRYSVPSWTNAVRPATLPARTTTTPLVTTTTAARTAPPPPPAKQGFWAGLNPFSK